MPKKTNLSRFQHEPNYQPETGRQKRPRTWEKERVNVPNPKK